MKALLGRKLRMTRIYDDAGSVVPVTLIQAGPCSVACVKTEEKDGYNAVQIAFETKKKTTKNGSQEAPRVLREVRLSSVDGIEEGAQLQADMFETGDTVKITSTTKGRGYTGVVKRHGFAGSPKTHGHKHDLRAPGSIGAAFPQHVMKGVKMAGRYGGTQNTVRGLEIVKVDMDLGVIAVKGSVPGAPGTLVMVRDQKESDEVNRALSGASSTVEV